MTGDPIERAQALQAAGKFLDAADIYAEMMGDVPERARMFLMIAEDALQRGDGTSAAGLAARAEASAAPDALADIAATFERARDMANAVRVNRRRTAATPEDARAWRDLGATLNKAGEIEDAEAATRRAIDLAPTDPVAHAHLAAIRRERRDQAGAMQAAGHALALDPSNAAHHVLKAELLLASGDLAAGFAEYEWRLKVAEVFAPARDLKLPTWDGGALDGSLLIVGEQGFGDVLQFCRFVPIAAKKASRTVLAVHPPLAPLLRSLPGVEVHAFNAAIAGPFAAAISLMSLPHVLATTDAPTPYLHASDDARTRWRDRVGGDGSKVGLCWRGNPEGGHDRGRSMTLDDLKPLADVAGVAWHAVQRDATADELAAWPAPFRDLGSKFETFDDTAAALDALDLIVTTDTALAHVAGAIGKPAFLLLRHVPAWRWGNEGERTAWYPSLRLFRQPAPGDWAPVVVDVVDGVVAAVRAAIEDAV